MLMAQNGYALGPIGLVEYAVSVEIAARHVKSVLALGKVTFNSERGRVGQLLAMVMRKAVAVETFLELFFLFGQQTGRYVNARSNGRVLERDAVYAQGARNVHPSGRSVVGLLERSAVQQTQATAGLFLLFPLFLFGLLSRPGTFIAQPFVFFVDAILAEYERLVQIAMVAALMNS
jgi:hypothetical protein